MKTFRKSLPFQLKAASETGEFRAVFATLNVVDHDGDITKPGAFKAGTEVIVGSWGHKTSELPVGKGVIVADDKEAAVEGSFFLDTAAGRDTYQTVKNLGSLGEWSYVFSVQKQSFGEDQGRPVRFLEDVQVYSVDPVLAGAGIDTRTTDIKALAFLDATEEVDEIVAEYVARLKERGQLLAKEGRTFSTANVSRLKSIAESLRTASSDLEELLKPAEPKANTDWLAREFARFQHIAGRIPA